MATRFRRGNKYFSKSSKCNQGHYHHSKLEAGYCNHLELLKKAGEIKDYKSQKRFTYKVGGHKICDHIVDFLVITNNDLEEVHECKGMELPVWNIKRKLFEALYPWIEYIVIKR